MNKSVPLTYYQNLDTLFVVVGQSLRDKTWANNFGHVLHAIKKRKLDNKINTVKIDFTNCQWADPIPYLSLILSLTEFVANGGKGYFIYPSEYDNNIKYQQFLKFSCQEGFAEQALLNGICLTNSEGLEITHSDVINNKKITFDLAYVDSTFIPAQIINLSGKLISIRKLISKVINNEIGQFQQIPLWAQEDIQYRLYLFLVETLINCKEHAYEKNSTRKYAGFYVRYRTGLINIPQQARANWKKNVNLEAEYCPPLRSFKDYLDHRDGCIEAFVIDAGMGIINSFKRAKISIKKYGKYPFRNIIKHIFLDGLTTKNDKLIPSGGLHLLHGMLGQNTDFIRGIDSQEWVGTTCPLIRHSSRFYELVQSQSSPNGLAWCARLSWRTKTDVGDNWARFEGGNELHPVRVALSCNIDKKHINYFSQSPVFDYRFDNKKIPDNLKSFKTNCCLVFTKPGMVKLDIRTTFKAIFKNKLSCDRQWNLIIADITPHEAETYVAAFVEQSWKENDGIKHITQIVLISQHWSVCILKKDKKKKLHLFRIEREKSKSFFTNKFSSVSPEKSIFDTVKWIKYFDSKLIWEAIIQDGDQTIYLPGKIEWFTKPDGSKGNINGYLDFSQILTLPLCYSLFLQALRRIIGLFPTDKYIIEPLDRLTKNLVEDFNSFETSPQDRINNGSDQNGNSQLNKLKSFKKIMVGSVIVTGETQKITGSKSEQTIHFFKHPFASSLNATVLFLWPDTQWLQKKFKQNNDKQRNNNEKYIRIGNTPIVALGGRKYFPVPRYDDSNNLIAWRNPSQSYNDWQNLMPQIVRIGHWVYEAHHDLLTVNLRSAIRHSFSTFGSLAEFVFLHFFCSLGMKETQLNSLGKKWLSQVIDRINEKENSFDLIVYPSHPNTEVIIEEFLRCVSKRSFRKIRRKIISFLPFRRTHSGSSLIFSPLILEKIIDSLKSSKDKSVLIFDDAIINGKTIRELKCIIDNAGAERISVLTLLNRNRMPQGRRYAKSFEHYWRLDVPVLGGERVCPFCRAQELIKTFIGSLASTRARERLRGWLHDWRPISTASGWDEGMKGIPLDREIIKKFSLKRNTEDNSYVSMANISLTRSIGLLVYACELHSMTGLDDVAIRICEKEKKSSNNLPWAARIELFSTQLLLFSEEYEYELTNQLILNLLIAICESKRSDKWTSLGCLTLFFIIRNDVTDIVDDALKLSERQPSYLNWDAQILLANLLHRQLLKDQGSNYDVAKRLLSVNVSNVSARYNHIHLETLDSAGYAHSRPLSRWASGKTIFDRRDKASAIAEVRDSLDKIIDVLITLDMGMARPRTVYFQKEKEYIISLSRAMAKLFKKYNNADEIASKKNCGIIIEKLRIFLDKYYFLKLNLSEFNNKRLFESTVIPDLFKTIDWKYVVETKGLKNKRPSLGISINWEQTDKFKAKEIWIVWDSNVVQIVSDLLMNSIHADKPMLDPWNRVSGLHDIWVSVKYMKKSLVIVISNNTTETSENVLRKIESFSNWSYLDVLGGKIYDKQIASDCIAICLELPYVGFLG